MAVRSGMTNLILQLRSMASVGTADYAVNGVSYWTDQQLQDRLDQYRIDLNRVPLKAEPEYDGGTPYYYDYYAPVGALEEATSGTVYWQVEDSDGDDAGTANYSADYFRGVVRFSADQDGTAYYLRARSYNLNRAAARIWREKAASVAAYYSFTADGQSFSRSDWYTHCMDMAHDFDADAGMEVGHFERTDLA